MEAPAWKRRAFRYLVSFPIIGMCLLSVFIVMFLMLRLQVIKFHIHTCSHTTAHPYCFQLNPCYIYHVCGFHHHRLDKSVN